MGERASGYDAITFDYWNTLIGETDAPLTLRRSLWQELLGAAGHNVDDDTLDEVFKAAWQDFDARWRRNQPSRPEQMGADAVRHLGLELSAEVREDLVRAYIEASLTVPRSLLPGVGETFQRLQAMEVRIGVVCDVGTVHSGHLRRWLAELGVDHLVDHFSFSDEVGVFKPDVRIFAHALEGLGVRSPGRAAHVGDLRRTDVAGARQAGMTSVRYTGSRDDTEAAHDEADHVIGTHLDLFAVLELD